MRRIRIVGACLVAACALGAATTATASAEPPEVGRCVPVEGVKEGKKTVYDGAYASARCTRLKSGHNGKYEWLPGPGPENKFFGEGEDPVIETASGAKVLCGAMSVNGEFTGAKTEKATISFQICEDPARRACQTTPAHEGEITGVATVEGNLAYINAAKHTAGWDLAREGGSGILFTYYCGKLPETIHTVEGSVIGQVKAGFFASNVNKMSLHGATGYKASHGKQLPEAFEGQPNDTLTTASTGLEMHAAEQTGLTTLEETISGKGESEEKAENQEPLEIKTK